MKAKDPTDSLIQSIWGITGFLLAVLALVSLWLCSALRSQSRLFIFENGGVQNLGDVLWDKLPRDWARPLDWSMIQHGLRVSAGLPEKNPRFKTDDSIPVCVFFHNSRSREITLPGLLAPADKNLLFPRFYAVFSNPKTGEEKKYAFDLLPGGGDQKEHSFVLPGGSAFGLRAVLRPLPQGFPGEGDFLKDWPEGDCLLQFIYQTEKEQTVYSNQIPIGIRKGN